MTLTNTSYLERHERRIVWLIVAFSLIMRCLTVFVLKIEPESDYLSYDHMARTLLGGTGMVDNNGNAAFMSAGYPLFVLTPIYALFGHSLLAAQIGNALLGGASTYLVYLLLCEMQARTVARILGPLLFALYIPSWIYSEYLAKENLMTPLLLLLLYLSARLYKRPTPGAAVALGVTLGLLAMTGSAALAVAPVVMCAMACAKASLRTRLQAAAIVALAVVIVLAPWQYRNAQVVGSPVNNTNGGFNLYLGNNPNADGLFVSIIDTPMGVQWKALRAQGELQASTRLKEEAIAWISGHPVQFVQLALKKAALFWMPPIHQGKGQASTMETASRLVWLVQYAVLCAFAVYTLLTIRRRNRYVVGVLAAVVFYTGVHMLFYVVFRYREPIMPLVILLAAIGVESLASRFGRTAVATDTVAAPERR